MKSRDGLQNRIAVRGLLENKGCEDFTSMTQQTLAALYRQSHRPLRFATISQNAERILKEPWLLSAGMFVRYVSLE